MGTAKPTARGQRGRSRSIRPPRRGSPTQLPSPSDLPAARSDGTTWRRRGAARTCGKVFLPTFSSLNPFPFPLPPLPFFPPHLKKKRKSVFPPAPTPLPLSGAYGRAERSGATFVLAAPSRPVGCAAPGHPGKGPGGHRGAPGPAFSQHHPLIQATGINRQPPLSPFPPYPYSEASATRACGS